MEETTHADRLGSVKRVALFLSGGNQEVVDPLRDAIAIELQNMGWQVVSRIELQRAVAQDFERSRAEHLDDSQSMFSPGIDEAQIAQLVHADHYVSGTVLTGVKRYSNQGEGFASSLDKMTTLTISLHVVEVNSPETIYQLLVDFLEGEGIPAEAVDVFKEGRAECWSP